MKIGAEELSYKPETKRALDIECLLLQIPLFAVVFVYAFDYIAWPVFFVLFYLINARYFIGTHDRQHADTSKRWPRFAEVIAERLVVCVTPWRDPYDSLRKKHMTHHRTHRPGKTPVLDTRNDPHSAFEMGGFLRAFLSTVFYEEVQLFFDIRNGEVAPSRWIILVIYLPLQILFLVNFGWEKYLGVLAGVRITSTLFFFFFSWGIHQPLLYRFGIYNKVPLPVRLMLGIANGKRTMDGFFRHVVHHAWPSLPPNRFAEFDSAVMRNPEAAPEMIASGR